MADETPDVDPHAEGELSVEEFFERGNARDRGDEVAAPPVASESAAAPAEPAATTKPRSSSSSSATPSARKKSIQADIDALATTKHQTRREVEETQAELARLRKELADLRPGGATSPAPTAAAPPPPPPQAQPRPAFVPPPPHDPEPRLEQFASAPDPYAAWSRETARWEARREYARIQSAQHADTMYRTRTSRLSEKLLQYETTHPGFSAGLHPDVAAIKFSTPRELGTPLGDLIVDSPHTAALLDYFTEHHQDFQRLSTLHPILAARELGKIESRFDGASTGPSLKPPPISHAKMPNKPVGHSPVISDDAEDEGELPMEEFFKRGNARDAARARTSGRR
jgi:hypothetical protein